MRKVGFFASGALVAALLLFSHLCSAAAAQTEVRIGVPPVPEFVPPMIADSEGYFKSRGLDALSGVIHPEPGSDLRGFRNLVWDLSGAADFLTLEVTATVVK